MTGCLASLLGQANMLGGAPGLNLFTVEKGWKQKPVESAWGRVDWRVDIGLLGQSLAEGPKSQDFTFVEQQHLESSSLFAQPMILQTPSRDSFGPPASTQTPQKVEMPVATEEAWQKTCAAEDKDSWIKPGIQVRFHSLAMSRELNGTLGMVRWWEEASQSWVVRCDDGAEKHVKPENIMLASPDALWGCNPFSTTWAEVLRPESKPESRRRGKRGGKDASRHSAASSSEGSETTAAASIHSPISSPWDASIGQVTPTQSADGPMTTVMMRNIPNDLTGTMLLKLLDMRGFNGLYDLVYLPMDYHHHVGFGYAFINFMSQDHAESFRDAFEGFKDWGVLSTKVCEVNWSSVLQGVAAHVSRYRNSPVMHEAVPDDFKPMLFMDGTRVPFPPPTKTIRPPRLRKKFSKADAEDRESDWA